MKRMLALSLALLMLGAFALSAAAQQPEAPAETVAEEAPLAEPEAVEGALSADAEAQEEAVPAEAEANTTPIDAAALEALLKDALQEEADVKAFYDAALKAYPGNRLLKNLARAEARHMALLVRLAKAEGLQIEATGQVPELPDSLEQLLDMAKALEEEDIRLYEELMQTEGLSAQVKNGLLRLQRASAQHLRAVERNIARLAQAQPAREDGSQPPIQGRGRRMQPAQGRGMHRMLGHGRQAEPCPNCGQGGMSPRMRRGQGRQQMPRQGGGRQQMPGRGMGCPFGR